VYLTRGTRLGIGFWCVHDVGGERKRCGIQFWGTKVYLMWVAFDGVIKKNVLGVYLMWVMWKKSVPQDLTSTRERLNYLQN
jgi:hypothetical protein